MIDYNSQARMSAHIHLMLRKGPDRVLLNFRITELSNVIISFQINLFKPKSHSKYNVNVLFIPPLPFLM